MDTDITLKNLSEWLYEAQKRAETADDRLDLLDDVLEKVDEAIQASHGDDEDALWKSRHNIQAVYERANAERAAALAWHEIVQAWFNASREHEKANLHAAGMRLLLAASIDRHGRHGISDEHRAAVIAWDDLLDSYDHELTVEDLEGVASDADVMWLTEAAKRIKWGSYYVDMVAA